MRHPDPLKQLGETVESLTLSNPQTHGKIMTGLDRLGKSISALIRFMPRIEYHPTDRVFDTALPEKRVNMPARSGFCQAKEERAGSYAEDDLRREVPEMKSTGGEISVEITREMRAKEKLLAVRLGVKVLRGRRGSEYIYVPVSVADKINKPYGEMEFEDVDEIPLSDLRQFFTKALFAAKYLHQAQTPPTRSQGIDARRKRF